MNLSPRLLYVYYFLPKGHFDLLETTPANRACSPSGHFVQLGDNLMIFQVVIRVYRKFHRTAFELCYLAANALTAPVTPDAVLADIEDAITAISEIRLLMLHCYTGSLLIKACTSYQLLARIMFAPSQVWL